MLEDRTPAKYMLLLANWLLKEPSLIVQGVLPDLTSWFSPTRCDGSTRRLLWLSNQKLDMMSRFEVATHTYASSLVGAVFEYQGVLQLGLTASTHRWTQLVFEYNGFDSL
jgi:hypothetical protein